MAMYAIGILPLILKLKEECRLTKQVWFADDASAAATCCHLRHWWDRLSQEGPKYGYYPNAAKTYLIVKEEYLSSAEQAFADTDIKITTSGKRHLGAALGSDAFIEEYVSIKVQEWAEELQAPSKIALSYPQFKRHLQPSLMASPADGQFYLGQLQIHLICSNRLRM
jgi:hypothetical protein